MVKELKSSLGEKAMLEAIAQGYVAENGEKPSNLKENDEGKSQKRSDLTISEEKGSQKRSDLTISDFPMMQNPLYCLCKFCADKIW